MQLSDEDIRKEMGRENIIISPRPEDHCFQPASVDLTLGPVFRYTNGRQVVTSLPFRIKPKGFVLAHAAEEVYLTNQFAGRLEGKSTLARHGLMVHCAGFVDLGFSGEITLELFNMSEEGLLVTPGQRIAQIAFYQLRTPCKRMYGDESLRSNYQFQSGATPPVHGFVIREALNG